MQAVIVPGVSRKHYRCVVHADGPVNWHEIEFERRRRVLEHRASAARAAQSVPSPTLRIVPPRPVTPFQQLASLPFDPRAAQVGGPDE